jgi:hypothetical protein
LKEIVVPSPAPAELKQLEQELAVERARTELKQLRAVKVAQQPKRLRTKLFEWLFRGGALLALLAMGAGYVGGREGGGTARHVAACERAHAAITDDAYNNLLTETEARTFKAQQLQIAARCNRDVEL